MPPPWLVALSWTALAVGVACAVIVLVDVYGRGHRQQMGVMEAVWPVNCLYLGPLALWMYRRHGRWSSPAYRAEQGVGDVPEKPRWASVGIGVAHCGAGCTLGDVVAEFGVLALGLTIAGAAFWAELIGDFALAVLLGLLFQFFAIAPMRGLDLREGLVAAAKADLLSLTAFEVGLFGWMAVMAFVLFPEPHRLTPVSPVYWFLMQIGMAIGFVTAWPANVWLLRRGVKEAM